MASAEDTARRVAGIYNAAFMVRLYASGRSSVYRENRTRAIRELGLTVRAAFNESEEFEALLTALADGLNRRDDRPF